MPIIRHITAWLIASVILLPFCQPAKATSSDNPVCDLEFTATSQLISCVRSTITIQGGKSNDEVQRAERDVSTRRTSPAYKSSSEAKIIGNSNEDCVTYAKRVTGIKKVVGYGARSGIEGHTPQVNAILAERSYKHAMVVKVIKSDGVIATEANFVRGKITQRFIPYSDILGYIY